MPQAMLNDEELMDQIDGDQFGKQKEKEKLRKNKMHTIQFTEIPKLDLM